MSRKRKFKRSIKDDNACNPNIITTHPTTGTRVQVDEKTWVYIQESEDVEAIKLKFSEHRREQLNHWR